MAGTPSVASRTAVELGIEQRDTNNDTQIRTAGLTQIPLYNASGNPVEARGETIELTRLKTGLAGDGVAIGAMSYAFQAEFYIFGSGIANIAPAYFDIIRACGFKEIRLASIARPSGTPTATSAGSGGSLSAGGYAYCFTVLYQSDGTTPATTSSNAAFESRPALAAVTTNAVSSFTDATTVANDSIAIASLPSSGIKRLYRTKAGDYASTDPSDFFFVAEVASGTTSYTDTLADNNLGRRAPLFGNVDVGSFAGTEDAGGSLDTTATYKYRFSLLYKADGTVATTEDDAAYEALLPSADEVSVTLTSTNASVALSGLPSTGVKRIYRTEGDGSTYKFVQNVASGTTTLDDGLADASLGHDLVEYADCAIYRPVSEYLDFDALTLLCYLDSRKYPIKSARGSFTMEGEAGQNVLCRVSLEGVYGTSTKTANPTLASNPGAPSNLCEMALKITAESAPTTDRDVKVLRFGLEVPRTPGARRDAQASCDNSAVLEYQINGPVRPRFTLTFEVPKEIGLGTDTDWINDFKVSEYFAIQFKIGKDARKRVRFQNWSQWGDRRYLAQLVQPPTFDTDQATGNRLFNGVFELTERTGLDNSFGMFCHY